MPENFGVDPPTGSIKDKKITKITKGVECQDENPVVNETRRKREGMRRPVIKCLYFKRIGAQGKL